MEGELDDYTVSLDFGTYGKLSYTSEQRCDTLPYFHVDGHVKRPGELYDGATARQYRELSQSFAVWERVPH